MSESFALNQAKYKPFRIDEIVKPEFPGNIVINLNRRTVKIAWQRGYELTNYNALRLLFDQNYESIRCTFNEERELKSIFKNAKLVLPENRKGLR